MTNCYLCKSSAEVYGQDYGRRKIVRCPNCGYYEVTKAALSEIHKSDFPKETKNRVKNEVEQINKSGGEPEILLVDDVPKVQAKHA